MVIVSGALVSSDIHLEKSWKKCSAHVFSYKSKKCKLSVGLYMNRIAVNHLIGCMITCRLLSVYLPRPRPWETTLSVSFLLLLDATFKTWTWRQHYPLLSFSNIILRLLTRLSRHSKNRKKERLFDSKGFEFISRHSLDNIRL